MFTEVLEWLMLLFLGAVLALWSIRVRKASCFSVGLTTVGRNAPPTSCPKGKMLAYELGSYQKLI